MTSLRCTALALSCALALGLAACGGGSDSPPPTPNPPSPPPVTDRIEPLDTATLPSKAAVAAPAAAASRLPPGAVVPRVELGRWRRPS
jgi:hypothetical protein